MISFGARRVAIFSATALTVLLWAGCGSPEKKVSRHMGQLRTMWETNLAHQANLPVQVVDWPTALRMVMENNLKLRQSRTDVTNTIENYRQIYKDLIPTLNARAGVSKALTKLNTLTPDDVTFNVNSFFNVPGVVNFGSRIYVGKLMMLRSRTGYALAEREQTLELYRLFMGVQEQQITLEKLAGQRANAAAMSQIDPFTGRLLETELQLRETQAAKDDRSLQQRASELFGNYRYKWVLSTNGLPDLRYSRDPLPLTDTNRVAQMQLRLLALELEAARMTLLGIKLRYWPELNIYITGPPIYQSIQGNARWWDADQLRGSADLYWQADTRGYVARQLRQTKRAQALQIEKFQNDSLLLMDRLLFTQDLMLRTQEQLDRTDKEMAFLLAVPPAQTYDAVQKYVEDYRQLAQRQIQLRRELAEFNALFWFVDEQAWPKPTAFPLP